MSSIEPPTSSELLSSVLDGQTSTPYKASNSAVSTGETDHIVSTLFDLFTSSSAAASTRLSDETSEFSTFQVASVQASTIETQTLTTLGDARTSLQPFTPSPTLSQTSQVNISHLTSSHTTDQLSTLSSVSYFSPGSTAVGKNFTQMLTKLPSQSTASVSRSYTMTVSVELKNQTVPTNATYLDSTTYVDPVGGGSETGLIVGLVIGLTVLVILVTIIALFLVYRKRLRNRLDYIINLHYRHINMRK